jgi:hypothetical protein
MNGSDAALPNLCPQLNFWTLPTSASMMVTEPRSSLSNPKGGLRRRGTEKAVLPSEVMQLPDRSGYLKLATKPYWMRISFDYLTYREVAPAFKARNIEVATR